MEQGDGQGFGLAPRVGCDLAEVAAVQSSIAVFGERYLRRIYSTDERSQTAERPERLAARFAGKEAVLKLLGVDGLSPAQVEIVNSPEGAPTVRLSAAAAASASAQGVGPIAISLSHEGGVAMATAVALATVPAGASRTNDSPQNSTLSRGNE